MSNSVQETQSRSSVADTDPQFLILRPDVREDIRVAEDGFRESLREGLSKLPLEIYAILAPTIVEMPARFLRGLLPFLTRYSEMLDQSEALAEDIRGAQRSKLN